ncbi:MAG: hypothetical protein ACQET8_22745 [Bacillota bacterium]
MEKTITINDRKVTFKSTGATPLKYKKQFHKDYLVDIMKMQGLSKLGSGKSKDIEGLDTEVLYNIIWVLAKGGDKDIPEPLEWYEEFDSFPLMEVIPEVQELIMSSIQSKKK